MPRICSLYQLQESRFELVPPNPDEPSLAPFLSLVVLGGLPSAVVGRLHFISASKAHCNLSCPSQSSRLWPSHVRLFASIPYLLQQGLPLPRFNQTHFFKWDRAAWTLNWQLTGDLSNNRSCLDTLDPIVVNKWDRSLSCLLQVLPEVQDIEDLGSSICPTLSLGSEKRQLAYGEWWGKACICFPTCSDGEKKNDSFPSQPFKNFF